MVRGSRRWRIAGGLLLAFAVGFSAFLIWAHEPEIAAIDPPGPARFAPSEVARGAALARVGYCVTCHQSAHGRPFAGGYGVRSPFGTIYGSNITPDPETGIGRWSEAAFVRALREGVSRDGHHLYPALPYDHFTKTSDRDLHALYAFLMTRPAVHAVKPANRMIPPLGFRPFVAGWKLLYFRPERFRPPAGLPAPLLRGAYLGETLAHCGGCHSPRGLLGAEQTDRAYEGGWADGWFAPPLDRHSPAVRAWTAERLYTYLTTGLDAHPCAVAMDVEVIADSGRLIVHRAVAAVDSGEAVNPDGIRNQVEGGIVQSLSWTAQEVVAHDAQRRTAFDWSTYPILRFADMPRTIEVEVIDRPGLPFLGTGEASQGPAGAALANAIAATTGQRRRALPLNPV